MANSAFQQRFLLPWSVVTINTAGEANKGYFVNSAGTVDISLPATSLVGDEISVMGYVGLFNITQGAGQQILFPGGTSTTLGAGGTATSTAVGDSVSLRCVVADTIWVALPPGGIITLV